MPDNFIYILSINSHNHNRHSYSHFLDEETEIERGQPAENGTGGNRDSLLTTGLQIPIPVFLHPIDPPPKLPPWPSCLPKLHVICDGAFLGNSTLLFEDVVSVTIPLEITAKSLENVSL